MRSREQSVLRAVGGALVVVGLAASAFAQEGPRAAMDDRWHFGVTPYFWFSGLEGTVSLKGIAEVPVDASFSDIWDNFDIGFLGRFEGRKNRVGFAADLLRLNLGAAVASDRPVLGQLGLEADVRATIAEGLVTYRVAAGSDRAAWLDVLGGVRYVGTNARLTGRGLDGSDLASTKQTIDWVDGVAGVRFRLPLGSRIGLHGRGDIAGFGSDFSWNLLGGLDVALGERWALGAGYRHLDVDYHKDDADERQLFQVRYDGPYLFATYAW